MASIHRVFSAGNMQLHTYFFERQLHPADYLNTRHRTLSAMPKLGKKFAWCTPASKKIKWAVCMPAYLGGV
jgi:hypothetical protein